MLVRRISIKKKYKKVLFKKKGPIKNYFKKRRGAKHNPLSVIRGRIRSKRWKIKNRFRIFFRYKKKIKKKKRIKLRIYKLKRKEISRKYFLNYENFKDSIKAKKILTDRFIFLIKSFFGEFLQNVEDVLLVFIFMF